MLSKLSTMVKSRRFWVAIAGVAVVCSNTILGSAIVAPETVQYVVLLAGSWIIGDSLRVTE